MFSPPNSDPPLFHSTNNRFSVFVSRLMSRLVLPDSLSHPSLRKKSGYPSSLPVQFTFISLSDSSLICLYKPQSLSRYCCPSLRVDFVNRSECLYDLTFLNPQQGISSLTPITSPRPRVLYTFLRQTIKFTIFNLNISLSLCLSLIRKDNLVVVF